MVVRTMDLALVPRLIDLDRPQTMPQDKVHRALTTSRARLDIITSSNSLPLEEVEVLMAISARVRTIMETLEASVDTAASTAAVDPRAGATTTIITDTRLPGQFPRTLLDRMGQQ